MKSSKDFFCRLNSDEAFAKEVDEAIKAKREAGAGNYCETIIPVAAERGYEITKEELDEINEKYTAELSEEELGKVAGGTSCLTVSLVATFVTSIASITYSVSELISAEPDPDANNPRRKAK